MTGIPCPTHVELLIDTALAWAANDPDAETRSELAHLIEAAHRGDPGSAADLADRFAGNLQFGTAGLRGALGAGPNRMNQVVVSYAAAGLGAYLNMNKATGDLNPTVVIGYDGRKNSREFAVLSAEILAGAGIAVQLMPTLTPTPVLAFAVRHLNASAGVMVTASHNPAADNGYKVYLGGSDGGSQIISPADAEIASCIATSSRMPVSELPRGAYSLVDQEALDAYTARTASIVPPPAAPIRFVHTAMHGVATEVFHQVLDRAGFPHPIPVQEQAHPDGTFPTVTFPNPEEQGALDLAFAVARAHHVDLIIAHDPDADRLSVAIPDKTAEGYRRLTGNEVGLLLGWWIARTTQPSDWIRRPALTDATFACSIVSSPALKLVADAYQLNHVTTLTGFKWISRAPGLLFGFEEALGYLVDPAAVHDKDGISAAMMFLSMAATLAGQGQTVSDALDAFSMRFGHHRSDQVSLRVDDLGSLMHRLRTSPPRTIADVEVATALDYLDGVDGLPASDVLRYDLLDGTRVMVRPSGTEPKLKIYVDVVATDGDLSTRALTASERLSDVVTFMTRLLSAG